MVLVQKSRAVAMCVLQALTLLACQTLTTPPLVWTKAYDLGLLLERSLDCLMCPLLLRPLGYVMAAAGGQKQ